MTHKAMLALLWAALALPGLAPGAEITAADPHVARMGRAEIGADGSARFAYPGVSFYVRFNGTRLSAQAQTINTQSFVDVIVDGKARKVQLASGPQKLVLAEGLVPGPHEVELVNRSETWQGNVTLRSFETDGAWAAPPALPSRKLLLLGDSITCGAAIDRVHGQKADASWANPRASFGMLMAKALNAQVQLVCYGGRGLVRTWENKTDDLNLIDYYPLTIADKAHPVQWNQQDYRPDAILIEIGTNDMNPGIPEREPYVQAYLKLLRLVLKDHPQAQIMLTEGGILRGEKQAVMRSYIAETVKRSADPRVHAIASTGYPGDVDDGHPTKEQSVSIVNDLLPQVQAVMHWQ